MADPGSETVPACFVCRCEEVTAEQLQAAMADGASSISDLKRRTRAGMGLCQGAYCVAELADMLSGQLGVPIEDLDPMTSRPPARAIGLDTLARSSE